MTAFYDFFSGTRHWELEPYFDVDGGRALALKESDYIVYVEKPGPLELLVEKHGYYVAWINPTTGERVKQKNFKGERFTGEPPDKSHDWVLHVSREGHMEGMARTYKFESRADRACRKSSRARPRFRSRSSSRRRSSTGRKPRPTPPRSSARRAPRAP